MQGRQEGLSLKTKNSNSAVGKLLNKTRLRKEEEEPGIFKIPGRHCWTQSTSSRFRSNETLDWHRVCWIEKPTGGRKRPESHLLHSELNCLIFAFLVTGSGVSKHLPKWKKKTWLDYNSYQKKEKTVQKLQLKCSQNLQDNFPQHPLLQ